MGNPPFAERRSSGKSQVGGVGCKPGCGPLPLASAAVGRHDAAGRPGLRQSDGEATLTDDRVAVVLVALKAPTRPHGAAWVDCVRHEATIAAAAVTRQLPGSEDAATARLFG